MKKYCILWGIASILAVSFSSCKKVLDQNPISTLSEENYYRNTAEIETAVIGCYSSLLPLYNDNYLVVDLRSDDTYVSESEGDYNQLDGFGERSTNSYLAAFWQESYYVIRQTNTVLKYINNVTDSVSKNSFEGEARFMRAHMYFNLVRLWGNIPLVVSSIDYDDPSASTQVSEAAVYDQIISDLTIAAEKLPLSWPESDASRVTAYAAKAMLGKVYLTQKNYAAALPLLRDVVENPGSFLLQTSYASIFGTANETNKEIMYSVRYRANSNGLGEVYTYNYAKLTGSQNVRVSKDLRNAFVTADSVRKNTTVALDGTYYMPGKFLDVGAPVKDAGADYIVLRLADVILMYAEVLNEVNGPTQEALDELNKIRARAGVTLYTLENLSTKDEFRSVIKTERRVELATEGHRLFDLLRWGDLQTAMNTAFVTLSRTRTVQAYQYLYPIPQREIDVTNGSIVQNPGY